ncbi:MAG: hypothetical protein QY323_03635 [Patescibacteria group bacterium]|nr:MAG: hypothetical protein QY323_03635 [Patescibacteria group bacterium]
MIDILTSTANDAWRCAAGTPVACPTGEASVAFMRQMKFGAPRVCEVRFDKLTLIETVNGARVTLTYEGGAEALRFIREAVWYYTRHPHLRRRVDPDQCDHLLRCSKQFRPSIEKDAMLFPKRGSEDIAIHWRYALLFAAGAKDANEIRRALAQPEPEFERLIEDRIEAAISPR